MGLTRKTYPLRSETNRLSVNPIQEVVKMRRTILTGCLMLAVAVVGCGAAGGGGGELATLVTKAEAEFTKRGEGTFVDTGYAS